MRSRRVLPSLAAFSLALTLASLAAISCSFLRKAVTLRVIEAFCFSRSLAACCAFLIDAISAATLLEISASCSSVILV